MEPGEDISTPPVEKSMLRIIHGVKSFPTVGMETKLIDSFFYLIQIYTFYPINEGLLNDGSLQEVANGLSIPRVDQI